MPPRTKIKKYKLPVLRVDDLNVLKKIKTTDAIKKEMIKSYINNKNPIFEPNFINKSLGSKETLKKKFSDLKNMISKIHEKEFWKDYKETPSKPVKAKPVKKVVKEEPKQAKQVRAKPVKKIVIKKKVEVKPVKKIVIKKKVVKEEDFYSKSGYTNPKDLPPPLEKFLKPRIRIKKKVVKEEPKQAKPVKKIVIKKKVVKEEPKKAVVKAAPKKAVVKAAPKVGSVGYVANYKDLSKEEQMKILLNQTVKPSIKKQEDYQEIAQDFYDQINDILNKSSSRAVKKLLDFGLSSEELTELFSGKKKGGKVDFFPTPKHCVEVMAKLERCPLRVLEGTAGIGSVVNAFYNYYMEGCGGDNDWSGKYKDDFRITANEREKKYVDIMKKFLPYEAQLGKQIDITNKDFFDLPLRNDYNMIFLNPPFDRTILFKFLLRGLQMINNSKDKYATLIFVSPGLTYTTNERNSKDSYYLGNLIKGHEGRDKGTIPKKKFVEIVNELSESDIKVNIKDLEKYLDGDLDDGKEDIFQEFDFTYGQGEGLCKGFGGTGTRAVMSIFQRL